MKIFLAWQTAAMVTFSGWNVGAFVVSPCSEKQNGSGSSLSMAKPQRLAENVNGVVYVNDQCINCAACSNFAPSTFSLSESMEHHVVHQQPSTDGEIQKARSALAACPVAAIRLETLAERRHRASSKEDKEQVERLWTEKDDKLIQKMQLGTLSPRPFPRRFLDDETLKDDVFWVGHHNERSFGATPYLLKTYLNAEKGHVWIMIDTPKFSRSAAKDIESVMGPGGPDYLFLTHVDDTADHNKWVQHWNENNAGERHQVKRIFHSLELDNNWVGDATLHEVEILLPTVQRPSKSLTAYTLDGQVLPPDWAHSTEDNVVILHTPGHSVGSITLYRRPGQGRDEPGILFTGDTYGWTPRGGGQMTAFPRYGDDLHAQAHSLQELLKLDWDIIAPGHGHPRDYRQAAMMTTTRQSDISQSVVGAEGDKTRRDREQRQKGELQVALGQMTASRRW